MNKNSHPSLTKTQRQQAVLAVIREEAIGTQRQLVAALGRRGLQVTQASLSRDLTELGLVKVGGRYQPSNNGGTGAGPDPELPFRLWVRAVLNAGPHMIVIKGDIGTAQRIGLAVDELAFEGVVGTVAGDDTVFAAVATKAAGHRLARYLRARMTRDS